MTNTNLIRSMFLLVFFAGIGRSLSATAGDEVSTFTVITSRWQYSRVSSPWILELRKLLPSAEEQALKSLIKLKARVEEPYDIYELVVSIERDASTGKFWSVRRSLPN